MLITSYSEVNTNKVVNDETKSKEEKNVEVKVKISEIEEYYTNEITDFVLEPFLSLENNYVLLNLNFIGDSAKGLFVKLRDLHLTNAHLKKYFYEIMESIFNLLIEDIYENYSKSIRRDFLRDSIKYSIMYKIDNLETMFYKRIIDHLFNNFVRCYL